MRRSKIVGLGHYVPPHVVKNADLEEMMNTTDAWIQERTGIKERRWIKYGEDTVASMGTKASIKALEKAGMETKDVDFIILATLSPDYYFPGPGTQVQHQLGVDTIGALDVRNQCTGFIYALSIADQFIKTGMYNNILVIGSEIHSHRFDKTPKGRSVSVIFGDGAAAAVMTPAEEGEDGVYSTHLHCEGAFTEELMTKGPGNVTPPLREGVDDPNFYPHMNGQLVFKHAVIRFSQVINEALEANNYKAEDIDMLIPHQANLRISQFIQKYLDLSDDNVYNNIMYYGNTTAASIPLALSEAVDKGKVKKDDLVCLAAFGAGFTWGSALIRWAY